MILRSGAAIGPPSSGKSHYLYQLVERPGSEHYRLLAELDIPRSEWGGWAFYVHAPDL